MQNSYILFKFHPFLQKILLNYSFYCCHFMFDSTQTWIFLNFLHLYDSSDSHFLICNEYAMIFSPETEIFLRNSDFFTAKPVSLEIYLYGQGQYACRHKLFLIARGFSLSNTIQNCKFPIFSSKSRSCHPFSMIFGNLYIFFCSCLFIFSLTDGHTYHEFER